MYSKHTDYHIPINTHTQRHRQLTVGSFRFSCSNGRLYSKFPTPERSFLSHNSYPTLFHLQLSLTVVSTFYSVENSTIPAQMSSMEGWRVVEGLVLQIKLAAHFNGERKGVLWIRLHLLHFPHWHLTQRASLTRWHFDRLSLGLVVLVSHSFVTTQMISIIVVSEPVSSCSSLSWSMKDTSEDESLLEGSSSGIIAGGDRPITMHTVWGVCVCDGVIHRTLSSPSYLLQVFNIFKYCQLGCFTHAKSNTMSSIYNKPVPYSSNWEQATRKRQMNNSYFIRKTRFEFESSLKGYLAIKCKKKLNL